MQGYWAVVQTESQREPMVRMLLMKARFETYAPRIKIRNRIAFLFPAYIFVQIIDQFYPVMWTPHVVRVLMSGERPARVPIAILEDIRKQEKGGFVRIPSRQTMLKNGDNVRISSGSFAGHLAIFDGMRGSERVSVLLELLGRQVSVELPQKDITPIQPLAPAA
jgi:transcriptional antiterminator RfaH